MKTTKMISRKHFNSKSRGSADWLTVYKLSENKMDPRPAHIFSNKQYSLRTPI